MKRKHIAGLMGAAALGVGAVVLGNYIYINT